MTWILDLPKILPKLSRPNMSWIFSYIYELFVLDPRKKWVSDEHYNPSELPYDHRSDLPKQSHHESNRMPLPHLQPLNWGRSVQECNWNHSKTIYSQRFCDCDNVVYFRVFSLWRNYRKICDGDNDQFSCGFSLGIL